MECLLYAVINILYYFAIEKTLFLTHNYSSTPLCYNCLLLYPYWYWALREVLLSIFGDYWARKNTGGLGWHFPTIKPQPLGFSPFPNCITLYCPYWLMRFKLIFFGGFGFFLVLICCSLVIQKKVFFHRVVEEKV